jgi:hypothetical protein
MMHSPIYRRNAVAATTPKRAGGVARDLVSNHTSGRNAAWRLPSGQALSEFALQAGFLVPHLFAADGRSPLIGTLALARESGKRAG